MEQYLKDFAKSFQTLSSRTKVFFLDTVILKNLKHIINRLAPNNLHLVSKSILMVHGKFGRLQVATWHIDHWSLTKKTCHHH